MINESGEMQVGPGGNNYGEILPGWEPILPYPGKYMGGLDKTKTVKTPKPPNRFLAWLNHWIKRFSTR